MHNCTSGAGAAPPHGQCLASTSHDEIRWEPLWFPWANQEVVPYVPHCIPLRHR